MADLLLKDTSGNQWVNASGQILKTRPMNQTLITNGLIGQFDADNVNNVGGFCKEMYNQAVPESVLFSVNGTATANGNIKITRGTDIYYIPVTTSMSLDAIAAAIRATAFANATVTQYIPYPPSAIITDNSVILKPNTTFDANGTGVDAAVYFFQGGNFIQNTSINQLAIIPNSLNRKAGLQQSYSWTKQWLESNDEKFYIKQMFLVMNLVESVKGFGFASHYGNCFGADFGGLNGVGLTISSNSAYPFYKNNIYYTDITAVTSGTPFILTADVSLLYGSTTKLGSTYTWDAMGASTIYEVAYYNRLLAPTEISYNMAAFNAKYNIY